MAGGTEKRQRDNVIGFRVDDAEYALIFAEADKAGVTVGTYARDVLIGAHAPRRTRRPPAVAADLVRILAGLGKIGSSVNSLAEKANAGTLRVVDPMLMLQLQDELEEMRGVLMAALGRTP